MCCSIIIHNYGYTSGSKEEAIALLESKGIIAELPVFKISLLKFLIDKRHFFKDIYRNRRSV